MSSQSSMTTLFESIQKRRLIPTMPYKDELPISQTPQKDTHLIGLRRRIASFSVNIQPMSSASSVWAFRRCKSMPAISELAGGPLRRWWEWGWSWILSRRPAFALDLEMNEQETKMLGCHNRGSWRHVFYRVRSEIRKLARPCTLPTTQPFRYDSFSYEHNFDDGKKKADE